MPARFVSHLKELTTYVGVSPFRTCGTLNCSPLSHSALNRVGVLTLNRVRTYTHPCMTRYFPAVSGLIIYYFSSHYIHNVLFPGFPWSPFRCFFLLPSLPYFVSMPLISHSASVRVDHLNCRRNFSCLLVV